MRRGLCWYQKLELGYIGCCAKVVSSTWVYKGRTTAAKIGVKIKLIILSSTITDIPTCKEWSQKQLLIEPPSVGEISCIFVTSRLVVNDGIGLGTGAAMWPAVGARQSWGLTGFFGLHLKCLDWSLPFLLLSESLCAVWLNTNIFWNLCRIEFGQVTP